MSVRGVLRRWAGEVVGLVLSAAAAYAVGLALRDALVLGVGVAAVVVLARRLDPELEPEAEQERRARQDGARGDLQDLAWSMTGRDGRAGERAMRRLREIAAVRLARHGLDLDDESATRALRTVLGDRAVATLRRRSAPLPSVRDVQHTLEVLERLGPRPEAADPSVGPAPGSTGAPGATDPSVPAPPARTARSTRRKS